MVLDLQLASGLNKDPQARGEMFVCIHSFLSSPSHSTVCAPKVPETEKKNPKNKTGVKILVQSNLKISAAESDDLLI